ncbi:MAG: hypothetical protein ACI4MI_01170 [Christensenellales bacterium]
MERSVNLKKALPLSLVAGFFILFLIINPSRYMASVTRSLLLFAKAVFPSLFPFLFFSRLLTCIGGGYLLGNVFARPVSKVFHAPQLAGYVMILSLISGYPVGSKIICDLCDAGMITKADAKRITAFCSTSGPLFILGTVGATLFDCPTMGYVILACHIVATIINGIIFRPKNIPPSQIMPTPQAPDSVLDSCIKDSIATILAVGGYITIFGMIGDVLIDVGVVDVIADAMQTVLKYFEPSGLLSYGISLSLIELTRGFDYIASSGVDVKTALPFLAGLVSMGGACITFQSMGFLSKCGVSTPYYLLTKFSQSTITFTLAFIVCRFVNFS